MRISLDGQVALVTGAGRGLGRAIALALAGAGAEVVSVARTPADLNSLREEGGALIRPMVADVLDASFYAQVEALERLDILVNNAGGNKPMPMVDVDDETLDRLLALNIRSVYKTAQAAARRMVAQGSGVIVNMSSQMGRVGSPRRTVYCLSKHAVEGLTKAMAVELAPNGVRVVSVAPTFVLTPMTEPMFANPDFSAFVMDRIPMKKLASVEDVANAVVFLASPAAGLITGESLAIDGGWTAQ
ncbi:SDR family NAD(P)-dependent oxidoreductase [Antarcticirhabdus aurantiaca]|uniref:SDR family NAD(P)-dependent oxidoreductase n=1 Tax=Antarcticirhabdus aurantiaca TaxID=2606717 RepID=A0ACD4NHV0_9HYPH|nr:SDR family oxidoreductase [Antarcticirhabdus aurantiaca]WAJ26388.1 SDR family NAD(P)-dependent oxidoreductase [Jeongeuplla avenae]